MLKFCFFSSDAAPLYKRDIFRIMGLPDGFVIHFRYGIEHINFEITKDNIPTILNSKCLLFFTSGNLLNTPIKDRNVKSTPLREASIEDILIKEDTGLIHFYLKLGSFKTCFIQNVDALSIPPYKFASNIEISNEENSKWHERIRSIKNEFSEQLFYKIDFLKKDRKSKVKAEYSKSEQQTFIQLDDENDFLLDISLYDTSDASSEKSQKLEIISENKDSLKVNAPQIIDIGARRDNRTYTLFTQSLNSGGTYTYLHFKTILIDDSIEKKSSTVREYNDIAIPIEIRKNKSRAFRFSIYSILAAISVGYGKLIVDKLSLNGLFSGVLTLHILFAGFLGCFSAFKLYQHFNKK